MAMRLTGLMSGMDTDSLIQELVASRKTKVDEAVKAQKKLEVIKYQVEKPAEQVHQQYAFYYCIHEENHKGI